MTRCTLRAAPIDLHATPAHVLGAWPAERPLAALWSGDEGAGERSRWTILASASEPAIVTGGPTALAELERCWSSTMGAMSEAREDGPDAPPFLGGWIGALAYDLGREIEPLARHGDGPRVDRRWPAAAFHRCAAGLAFDHRRGVWWSVGEREAAAELEALARAAASAPAATSRGFGVGRLASATGRSAYLGAVARTVELIRGGDIYQANLTHRLTGPFEGSARALFARLAAAARPWCGAYIELDADGATARPRQALASLSPELFLELDLRTGRAVTRPMKGTRRAAGSSASELAASLKDLAELNMIIDLMRNDLGRAAQLGSVSVDDARTIELHGSGDSAVLQGVATVSARLAPEAALADVLAATFPGGSVTGAPKIRAMQIIEELEPLARGPYCGSIGYVSDCGRAAFSIAIRTAHISAPAGAPLVSSALDAFPTGSTLDFGVGAGIVADSDPAAEWRETLDKAAALLALSGVSPADLDAS